MRVFEKYEKVEITDFAAEGKCIYKSPDGVIFVEGNVAPGDVVDLEVVGKKKKFKEAVVRKIHSHSPLRTQPYCSHHDTCGGCRWQHIDYNHQLRFKRQQVVDHFERIGKLQGIHVNDIIPADEKQFYRNKLEFTFSNNRWLTREEISSGLGQVSLASGLIPSGISGSVMGSVFHRAPPPKS